MGRLAISLLVLLTARRFRRSFRTEQMFSDALHFWGLRLIAPVQLLRGSLARIRT